MKRFRVFIWALIALLAAYLAYQALAGWGKRSWTEVADISLGGPFELVRHTGEPITEKDLAGRPYAIFFGFTHCPEICPTTLFEASAWLKQLGDDADRIDFYFVTVDPERDTPALLSEYISSFDPRIVAMTGTPEAISEMLASYRIYARKVPLEEDDYTMDHSASILLFRADGSFQGTIAWGESGDIALAKLKRLIGS